MELAVHLSWSPILLIIVSLLNAILWIAILVHVVKMDAPGRFKRASGVVGAWVLMNVAITALAFDVGHRQADLNRSNFNATVSEEVTKKVDSDRTTVEDVKKSFEQSVKQTEQ